MSWRAAFSELAAIPVAGVLTRYDLSNLPNSLPAADLPALAPAFVEEGAGSDTGLTTLTYDGAAWTAQLIFEHVLYWAPAWSEAGLGAVLPDLVDAIDAYLEAISANGRLGETLDRELEILNVRPGVVEYAGVRFYGVRFRHRWTRVIT